MKTCPKVKHFFPQQDQNFANYNINPRNFAQDLKLCQSGEPSHKSEHTDGG